MNLYKANGCGNSFIIIDGTEEDCKERVFSEARKICKSKLFNVDGILYLESSQNADVFMNIINSDGSIAKMCGNGIRCVAQYLNNLTPQKYNFKIETLSGVKTVNVCCNDEKKAICRVDMGKIKISPKCKYFDFLQKNVFFDEVDTGNKHAVFICDEQIFRKSEHIYAFLQGKDGINVEFVDRIDGENVKARVFERGCGETMACGSGAVAIAYSLYEKGFGKCFNIKMPGGVLNVSISGGRGYLTAESEILPLRNIDFRTTNTKI